MKQIIIADISSVRLENNIFGHYGKVARMYCNLFKNDAPVCIAGGKIYKEQFPEQNRIDLPFDCELNSLKSLMGKIKFKICSIVNGIRLFGKASDSIIVCQPYSFASWMLSLAFSHKAKSNKIYLIEYRNQLDKKSNRILFGLAKKKISGILCPNKEVGEAFGLPYRLVTDYIYDKDDLPKENVNLQYDFGVFGIMSNGKDIKDVVDSFSGSKFKVLIAGYFGEKKKQYCENQTDNITVIDKYLSDAEYDSALNETKYIILPYKDAYKSQSSGVVFDILFRGKPVLTKNFPTFKFVKDYDLGVLYENSLSEVDFDTLIDKEYEEFYKNICGFIAENKKQKEEILKFFEGDV